MKYHHIIPNICLIAMLSALISCGSSHNAISGTADSDLGNKDKSKDNSLVINNFYTLVDQYTPWQSIQLPATINVSSPNNITLSARITMVRDSLVHISLRMIGFEVAVIHIDNDSLYAVDKYHKYIFRDDIKKVMSRYPITLANVQDILIGRLFVAGKSTLDKNDTKDFMLTTDTKANNIWFAFPQTTVDNATWHFDLLSKPLSVNTLSFFSGQAGGSVSMAYSDFNEKTEIGTLPSYITILASLTNFRGEGDIRYNLKSIQINCHNDFNWTPPQTGYKTLSSENIKQMFSL